MCHFDIRCTRQAQLYYYTNGLRKPYETYCTSRLDVSKNWLSIYNFLNFILYNTLNALIFPLFSNSCQLFLWPQNMQIIVLLYANAVYVLSWKILRILCACPLGFHFSTASVCDAFTEIADKIHSMSKNISRFYRFLLSISYITRNIYICIYYISYIVNVIVTVIIKIRGNI